MSVNEIKQKETSNSTYEFRFLELEAGYRRHEESLKTVENLSKQLTEVKNSLVRIFCVFSDFDNYSYILNLSNNQKGIDWKKSTVNKQV